MNSYREFLNQNQIQIIKDTSQENITKTTIEMSTNSIFFQELFFTKTELSNNTAYWNLIGFIIIAEITIATVISSFIFGEDPNGFILAICWLVIFSILMFISTPLYSFLEKKLFTKIDKINLTFYPHGLELIPNTYNKPPIFIESLNISKIYLKPKIEEHEKLLKEHQPNDLNYLNIMLKLNKPITNPLTMENIKELPLIEDIHKDFFREEAINFIEEIKQTLNFKDR